MDTASCRLQLNPHVAALPPYNAGMSLERARQLSGRDDVIRLASNENPDGCSPAVRAVLTSAAFDPSRYADPACLALRSELSGRLGVEAAQIVVGNGSEEMIAALSRAVLVEGSTVATVVPSFGLHEIEPLAAGARVVKIPMSTAMDFDLEALEAAIRQAPRIVFLSSPWNPVGALLDAAGLDRLIAAVQPGTLFVLDEAYHEFAGDDAPDGLEVLKSRPIPWVVLRTFSKAYGLAGLRVGYAVCSDNRLAAAVTAAKTPFNVNAAAQAAAIAAFRDDEWMRSSVARTVAERDRVSRAIARLGLAAAPSRTNFVFFDGNMPAATLAGRLLSHGIIVKAWTEPGYERFIRVTIGKPGENDRFLDALARSLESGNKGKPSS